jgi:multiple sugar transport system permease protein/raffinose/stachyose/melibiose transport system permease protein
VRQHRTVFALGVVLPLLVYIAFVGYPLVYTVYLSFQQWDGFSKVIAYRGLLNYRELIHDPNFWIALGNTIKWTIGALFFSNVLAFLLAVALRSSHIYFGTVLRLLFFLPVTMSLVAIGLMFSFILTPAFGGLAQISQWFGGSDGPDLLGDPHAALYTLIGVFVWSYLGIPLVLYDAGLTQIPEELYEAARLEGASGWQQMRLVTLPLLRPITMVITVLVVLEALRAFDLVLVMTRGGPGHASDTLGYFMWIQSFDERRFGYGAAISVVMLLLSSVFAILYIRRSGRDAGAGGI